MIYHGTNSEVNFPEKPEKIEISKEEYTTLKNSQLSPEELSTLRKIAEKEKQIEIDHHNKLNQRRDKFIKKYSQSFSSKYLISSIFLFISAIIFAGIITYTYWWDIHYHVLGSVNIGVCLIEFFGWVLEAIIIRGFIVSCKRIINYNNSNFIRSKINSNHPNTYDKKSIRKLARAYKKYYKIKDIIKVN